MFPRGASILILRTRFSRAWDDVVLAGQHLQEPEPEEDDREQHERDAAEHGDAHRELRRDRRAALLEIGGIISARPAERAEAAGRVGAAATPAGIVGEVGKQDAPADGVDRERQQRVEDDDEQDLADEQERDRRVHAEQELEDGEADPATAAAPAPTATGMSEWPGSRSSRTRPAP